MYYKQPEGFGYSGGSSSSVPVLRENLSIAKLCGHARDLKKQAAAPQVESIWKRRPLNLNTVVAPLPREVPNDYQSRNNRLQFMGLYFNFYTNAQFSPMLGAMQHFVANDFILGLTRALVLAAVTEEDFSFEHTTFVIVPIDDKRVSIDYRLSNSRQSLQGKSKPISTLDDARRLGALVAKNFSRITPNSLESAPKVA